MQSKSSLPIPSSSSSSSSLSSSSSGFPSIPYKNDASERQSWWMVDLQKQSNFPPLRGATALLARCMRVYGWDSDKGRRVLESYRQFLMLKKRHRDWDATLLSPCFLVDQMWQQHILDIVHYNHDMVLLCGHVVGRNPDEELDAEAKKVRLERTREGLREQFAEDYDEEMWHNPKEEDVLQKGEVATSKKVGKAKKRKRLSDAEGAKSKKNHRKNAGSGQSTATSLQFHLDAEPKISRKSTLKDSNKYTSSTLLHKFRQLRSSGKPITLSFKAQDKFSHNIEFGRDVQLRKVLDWYKDEIFPRKEYSILQFTHSGKNLEVSKTAEKLKLKDGDIIDVKVSSSLLILILDEYGERTQFNIFKTAKLDSIFKSYAQKKGVENRRLRFSWCGEVLKGSESPSSLGLKENDVIYCMMDYIQEKKDSLSIYVRDEAGVQTEFKIKETQCLSHIFNSYATKKKLDVDNLRFFFKGEIIFGHNTPQTVELSDRDKINCVVEQPQNEHITLTITIKDQAGETVFFKVFQSTTFKKIFSKYCQVTKKNIKTDELCFFFKGNLIGEDDTPLTLGLEDNDEIQSQSKNAPMHLSIRDQTGEEIFFKVCQKTRLSNLFSVYASRNNVRTDSLRFTFSGQVIHGYDTPLSLGLENHDEINVQSIAITVIVRDQREGAAVFYKILRSTKLGKVFTAHAKRNGIEVDELRFLIGGEEIHEDSTPLSLGLEENDEIHVQRKCMNISVKNEKGEKVFFKVKETTILQKIINAYAACTGVEANSLYFFTSTGANVTYGYETPLSLGLEDNDEIHVVRRDVPLTIIVRDQTGEQTFFKVKKTTLFSKVFTTYASRKGIKVDCLYFLIAGGRKVYGYETPSSLDIQDEAIVDAFHIIG